MRAHRGVARLTRAELAAAVGVSLSSIAGYENGSVTPSAPLLGRLAATLRCEIGALYSTGADPSSEYWTGVCAALPPLTTGEVADVAAVLRRIDAWRSSTLDERNPQNDDSRAAS